MNMQFSIFMKTDIVFYETNNILIIMNMYKILESGIVIAIFRPFNKFPFSLN